MDIPKVRRQIPFFFQDLFNKGASLYFQTNYDSALIFFEDLFNQALEKNDSFWLARSLQGQGLCFQEFQDFEKAIPAAFEALEIYEEIGSKRGVAQIHGNLANIYYILEDFDTAIEENLISARLNKALGNVSGESASYHNVATMYTAMDSLDLALEYMNKSRRLFESSKDSNYYFLLYLHFGDIFLKKDQLDSAEYYMNKAKYFGELFDQTGFFEELNFNYGRLALKKDQFDAAIKYFQEGLKIAEGSDDFVELKAAYHNLSSAYESIGDFQNAYAAKLKENQYNDSLAISQRTKDLNLLNIEYQTEQKEHQLAEQALLLSRQRNRMIITIAISGFLVSIALIAYLLLRAHQLKKSQQVALALQKQKAETEYLKAFSDMKSKFFSNISHEFRTPLTLIIGPIQDALEKSAIKGRPHTLSTRELNFIQRNSLRLQHLVNQLLDLSKLETGEMKLILKSGNLISFTKAIVFSFESLADRKDIDLVTQFPKQEIVVPFDQDKLEKILSNLLSNAFKFTPEGGRILINVEISEGEFKFRVTDTGKGIKPEEMDRIFERFYQVEGTESTGSGIGLSLVKELVDLYKGHINIESKPGQGSSFTVDLPLQGATTEYAIISEPELNTGFLPEEEVAAMAVGSESTTDHKDLILVVEDNKDLSLYIQDVLKTQYRIIAASNGQEGLEKAVAEVPDLIISDVMMPKMNGEQLLKKIRSEIATSHIPVILLTAKAGLEHKLTGLKLGADEYLTKPFESKELLVRCANLIKTRKDLQIKFSQHLKVKADDIPLESKDALFLQQVMDTIKKNMDNEFFGVEDLAAEVALSRSQLNRKLKAICDQSPSSLIRTYRLSTAKELLENKTGNISEIAFQVGYSNISYFTKSFKKEFGLLPSEIA